jgi:hypothetical protein
VLRNSSERSKSSEKFKENLRKNEESLKTPQENLRSPKGLPKFPRVFVEIPPDSSEHSSYSDDFHESSVHSSLANLKPISKIKSFTEKKNPFLPISSQSKKPTENSISYISSVKIKAKAEDSIREIESEPLEKSLVSYKIPEKSFADNSSQTSPKVLNLAWTQTFPVNSSSDAITQTKLKQSNWLKKAAAILIQKHWRSYKGKSDLQYSFYIKQIKEAQNTAEEAVKKVESLKLELTKTERAKENPPVPQKSKMSLNPQFPSSNITFIQSHIRGWLVRRQNKPE